MVNVWVWKPEPFGYRSIETTVERRNIVAWSVCAVPDVARVAAVRGVAHRPGGAYERYGKRVLDVVVSGIGLVITAPLQAAVAIQVRRKLGSPVLFRQLRPGRGDVPFVMLKFRSMTDETGPDGDLLPDAQRLPPFGQFLRASSLDELPGLVNVWRGDLSLVGPRPLLMQYLPLYSPRQRRRHEVRPGLTGLAQVNGRNSLSWDAKLELDVQYVESVSFHQDCAILASTFVQVVRQRGINAEGHVTAPEFTGNESSG